MSATPHFDRLAAEGLDIPDSTEVEIQHAAYMPWIEEGWLEGPRSRTLAGRKGNPVPPPWPRRHDAPSDAER